MQTWVIKYTRIPTAYHRSANAIVDAETAEDAKELLTERLGDGNGVKNYVIDEPHPQPQRKAKGRIISLGGGE